VNARRIAAGTAALLASGVIAACSSSAPSTPAQDRQAAGTATATHWWSGTDYCTILRQTMRAGHSILPGATAGDPKLLTATKAFVSDLTAAAPDSVRAQWQVLGPALTDLVESGGKPSAISGVNSRLVAAAATAIAADAKARCRVDVSA
jgi:hypothetical protein